MFGKKNKKKPIVTVSEATSINQHQNIPKTEQEEMDIVTQLILLTIIYKSLYSPYLPRKKTLLPPYDKYYKPKDGSK